jgi:hypothetical protein
VKHLLVKDEMPQDIDVGSNKIYLSCNFRWSMSMISLSKFLGHRDEMKAKVASGSMQNPF